MSLPSFETNPNEASDKKEGVWTYLNQQTCGDPKNTRNYVLYWHILTMCVRFYWPKIGVVIRYQTWINTCTITDKHVDTIWYYIIYMTARKMPHQSKMDIVTRKNVEECQPAQHDNGHILDNVPFFWRCNTS